MNNKDFEPIRIRIMQEAYNLADEGSVEGYNAVKVMCGDVQKMLPPQREWVGLTDEEIWETISRIGTSDSDVNPYAKLADARAIEAKLRSKNT